MYDISIVIVSWNAKDFLKACLDSLRPKPPSVSIEIIVVDNASSDGSAELVEEFYPEVKLIKNKQNFGFAMGNNIGIKESQGRYVYLINSDIKILADCLIRLYNYMEENASIGILAPKILNSDLSLQCTCRHFPTLWNNFCFALGLNRIFPNSSAFCGEQMFYFKHDAIRDIEVLAGCFLVVRREALEQVGYLDDQFFIYAEDIDWCKRFWESGWRVVFFPGAEAIHYGGASSSNAPLRFSAAQEQSRVQYWSKHHRKLSVLAFYCIIISQHALRIFFEGLTYVVRPATRTSNKIILTKHFSCLRVLLKS